MLSRTSAFVLALIGLAMSAVVIAMPASAHTTKQYPYHVTAYWKMHHSASAPEGVYSWPQRRVPNVLAPQCHPQKFQVDTYTIEDRADQTYLNNLRVLNSPADDARLKPLVEYHMVVVPADKSLCKPTPPTSTPPTTTTPPTSTPPTSSTPTPPVKSNHHPRPSTTPSRIGTRSTPAPSTTRPAVKRLIRSSSPSSAIAPPVSTHRPTPVAYNKPLASTGSHTGQYLGIGIGLLLIGFGLNYLARKRGQHGAE